jgi:hypothetical protein
MSWKDLFDWPCTGASHCACFSRQSGMCCGCGKRRGESWKAWAGRLRWNVMASIARWF